MAKVLETLPNAMFRVELERKANNQVLAHIFGKDAQTFYSHSSRRPGPGGTVALRFKRGRITYDYK